MIKVPADLIRVIDGDTSVFKIDLEEEFEMTLTRTIRFLGINAPEKRGGTKEQGMLAKSYAETRLREAKDIQLQVLKRDSFGRLLAIVHIDDVNLCEEMLREGYAVPYSR